MTDAVLVIGGYGVFGGRLSQALARMPQIDLIVAGRSIEAARAFCDQHGGRPLAFDRAAPDLAARIAGAGARVVIDASGPFQAYGDDPYALARAAIKAGAHYVDLSDDAAFSAGIGALDQAARGAGVAVISGASSVPGLSSAAVRDLAQGFAEILRIDSVILPGNRAPRGLSVVRAILAQAGRPLTLCRAGRRVTVPGWSGARREYLTLDGAKPLRRWSSYIGGPDLALFPEYFNARTVEFRAGLELPILHFGLWLISLPVRWGWAASLAPAAAPIRRIAQGFAPFGSDRGGMAVRVLGRLPDGRHELRIWTLIAEAGDGPSVPTLAARILCNKALAGQLPAGARPCLAEFSLDEATGAAADLAIVTGQSRAPMQPLFRQALGDAYDNLPRPVRQLHDNVDIALWQGQAEVTAGRSWLAGLIRRVVGFPSGGSAIPVTVEMRRDGDSEIWQRRFAGKRFRSELKLAGSGRVTERFGPFRFLIALTPGQGDLAYPVERGWFCGLPLPRWLLPASDTIESAPDGRFHFDVAISLPLIGPLVRYRGWLRASDAAPARQQCAAGR